MKKPIATVLISLIVLLLAFVAGSFSWEAHVMSQPVSMGYFGVVLPVLAVIAAFCTGRAASLLSQTLEG